MRAFIALLLVAAATAKLAPLHKNSEPIPGKYIIKLKDGYQPDAIASTVRVSGGRVAKIFRRVFNGFAADLSDKVLNIVRNHPAVEYVEQDGVVRAQAVTWGIDRCDQSDLPLDNSYSTTGNGNGRKVYVIDTGIRITHSEFGGVGGRASWGYNAQDSYNEDCNGHGTHCAGTVAGTTYGIAKGANVIAVKVLGCLGSGSFAGIIDGMDWVGTNAPSGSVASMSLGGGKSVAVNNAVANLVSDGVTVVVAAGNDNANACDYSPASASEAITVGATTSTDARSSFSNYGTCVDIFAPGSSITSAWHTSDSATNTISGTSMACPHVAGGAALAANTLAVKTPTNIRSTLIDDATANKVSSPGFGSANLLLYVGNY